MPSLFRSISRLFCEYLPCPQQQGKGRIFLSGLSLLDALFAKPAASAKTANRSIEEKSPPTNHEKIPPNSSKISKCAPAKQTAPKPALACPSHPRKPRRRLDDQTASKAFFFPQRQGGKDYEFSRPARRNKKPKQFSSQRQGAPKPKNSQSRQTTPKAALARPSHPRKPMRRFLDDQTTSKAFFSLQRQGDPKPKIPKTAKLRRKQLWLAHLIHESQCAASWTTKPPPKLSFLCNGKATPNQKFPKPPNSAESSFGSPISSTKANAPLLGRPTRLQRSFFFPATARGKTMNFPSLNSSFRLFFVLG